PFDSNHVAYATGATVYDSHDFSNVSSDLPTHWSVWAEGIEETAVITLVSPTQGPHLLSGFGDICGFVHDDLTVSPKDGMFRDPIVTTTVPLDCAGSQPNVVVRSGNGGAGHATLAWSEDGGHSWHPIATPQTQPTNPGARRRLTSAIAVAADGSTFMLM